MLLAQKKRNINRLSNPHKIVNKNVAPITHRFYLVLPRKLFTIFGEKAPFFEVKA